MRVRAHVPVSDPIVAVPSTCSSSARTISPAPSTWRRIRSRAASGAPASIASRIRRCSSSPGSTIRRSASPSVSHSAWPLELPSHRVDDALEHHEPEAPQMMPWNSSLAWSHSTARVERASAVRESISVCVSSAYRCSARLSAASCSSAIRGVASSTASPSNSARMRMPR